MKALCWHGKNDIRVDNVPDRIIINERDAIIKVTSTAICGSDLQLLHGLMLSMESGDILVHEFMSEVVEVGVENKKLKVGDKVVVPFTISFDECFFVKENFFLSTNFRILIKKCNKTNGSFSHWHILLFTFTWVDFLTGKRNMCVRHFLMSVLL